MVAAATHINDSSTTYNMEVAYIQYDEVWWHTLQFYKIHKNFYLYVPTLDLNSGKQNSYHSFDSMTHVNMAIMNTVPKLVSIEN